jgi:hypothetical protein
MPRVDHARYILPGDNWVIDRAGWQCTAADSDEPRGRCRYLATHVHRRRESDRLRFAALCAGHYTKAGAEAVAR